MRLGLFIYSFMFILSLLRGQDMSWTASVSSSKLFANQEFEVSFTLKNADGSSFRAPTFGGLEVLSGPSRNTSISIVNGRKSQSLSMRYSLMAEKEGEYNIGPAEITVQNKKYKTQPFRISVQKSNGNNAMANFEDIEVRAEISDSIAHVGQQLVLEYVVYYDQNIGDLGIVREDDYEDFYIRDSQDPRFKSSRVLINGERINRGVLKTVYLYPQKTGVFTVKSGLFKVGVEDPRGGRRNFFGFKNYITKNYKTEPIDVVVQNIPEPPSGAFSGSVGIFQAQAELNKQEISTNESATLTLTVVGDGDIKKTSAPKIQLPKGLSNYDPTLKSEEIQQQQGKYVFRKVFEYIIVPERTGDYVISPKFVYYNTDSSNYVSIPLRQSRLKVIQGDKLLLKEKSEFESELSSRPVKQNVYSEGSWIFMRTPKEYYQPLVLLLCLGAVFWYALVYRPGHLVKLEKKNENTLGKRTLKEMDRILSSSDSNEAKSEKILELFNFYTDKKMGKSIAKNSVIELTQEINKRLPTQSEVDALKTFTAIEASRYTGNVVSTETQRQLRGLINELDKLNY